MRVRIPLATPSDLISRARVDPPMSPLTRDRHGGEILEPATSRPTATVYEMRASPEGRGALPVARGADLPAALSLH
jgi:hypothetical protein